MTLTTRTHLYFLLTLLLVIAFLTVVAITLLHGAGLFHAHMPVGVFNRHGPVASSLVFNRH